VDKNPKKIFRNRLLNLLRSQKEEERLKKSSIIREKLFLMPEFQQAHTILFYASFNGEVETFEMMKQAQKLGKKIALPKIIKEQMNITPVLVEDLDKELIEGPFGIKEPKQECLKRSLEASDVDMVVVPGLAFDKNNNRLGRGGGCYDRFLKIFPSKKPSVGLAFDFQILDSLPHVKGHDIPVSRVIVN